MEGAGLSECELSLVGDGRSRDWSVEAKLSEERLVAAQNTACTDWAWPGDWERRDCGNVVTADGLRPEDYAPSYDRRAAHRTNSSARRRPWTGP